MFRIWNIASCLVKVIEELISWQSGPHDVSKCGRKDRPQSSSSIDGCEIDTGSEQSRISSSYNLDPTMVGQDSSKTPQEDHSCWYHNRLRGTLRLRIVDTSSSSLSTWNQGGFETGAVGNHHPFNFITPDQWNHYLHENSVKCQTLIQPHQFLSFSSSKLTSGMIYNHHHQLQKQHEIPQQQKQSFCQPETIVLSTSSPERKETIDERGELLKKKEKNSSLTPEMREKIELKKRQAQEIKAQRIRAALEAERIQNEKKVAARERCLREFGITSGPTREKLERFNGRTGSSDEIKVATEEKEFISLEDQRDKHLMLESV
ncbi:hypothetical protein BY996DRAFT_8422662 [Phakopsora pachyrhizi]|nr:hypothetical protein BY996DRAFT_8422662 [Phakopsora pachyrhizi]